MMTRRIMIVGGSTRAAADSVRRAGWQPICADLFADLDLRNTADTIPVSQYPLSLPNDTAKVHAEGWFYCGALENQPDILNQLNRIDAAYGPLIGTAPEAFPQVRDPFFLAEILNGAGLLTLNLARSDNPPAADGSWLRKPLASAGGREIQIWDSLSADSTFPELHYFQKRIAGISYSAVIRVSGSQFEVMGITKEFKNPFGSYRPSDFTYAGTIGPVESDDETSVLIRKLASEIMSVLVTHVKGLHGLIGLDFIVNESRAWLLEVNPRYTASVEILEWTSGRSFLNQNVTAQSQQQSSWNDHSHPRIIAKQIVYAERALLAPDFGNARSTNHPWKVPRMADIPVPGSIIDQDWPICSVFGTGSNENEACESLLRHLTDIQSVIERARSV